jgi:hypothetical protein
MADAAAHFLAHSNDEAMERKCHNYMCQFPQLPGFFRGCFSCHFATPASIKLLSFLHSSRSAAVKFAHLILCDEEKDFGKELELISKNPGWFQLFVPLDYSPKWIPSGFVCHYPDLAILPNPCMTAVNLKFWKPCHVISLDFGSIIASTAIPMLLPNTCFDQNC